MNDREHMEAHDEMLRRAEKQLRNDKIIFWSLIGVATLQVASIAMSVAA